MFKKDMYLVLVATVIVFYSLVGTGTRVKEIKERAPSEISKRNWKIERYEGYQYGSWGNHGGKVWYHVKDLSRDDVYYRVYVTLWDDELHFTYGSPEKFLSLNIK